MNMNADQPDFEDLQRLLKLKRYENPPPRYFNDFSSQVINRIKSSRLNRGPDAPERARPAWLQRILSAFREGPVLAGACAAALITLLAGGAIYTEKLESAAQGFGGVEFQTMLPTAPVLGNVSPLASVGTNADSSLAGSAFFEIGLKAKIQQAGWRPLGR
jgi:hypothetical protein